MVTTIIKARAATHKKGKIPVKPVELIVRRVDEKRGLTDEVILRLGQDEMDEVAIEHKLIEALHKIAKHMK